MKNDLFDKIGFYFFGVFLLGLVATAVGWFANHPGMILGLIVAAIIIILIMIPVNEAADKAMAKENAKQNAQMRMYQLREHRKTTFNNPSWMAWAANKPHVIAQEREYERAMFGV